MSPVEWHNPDRWSPTSHFSASPGQIAELAEARLRKSPYLALANVSCEFREGVLTLHGCLPRYHLKQVAQEVIAAVPGVEQIDNQIEVVAAMKRGR
jgi:osmotically-inducible protein OsmY